MKLQTVVNALNEKFEVSKIKEDWSWAFDYLVPKYKLTVDFCRSSIGLMFSSGNECQKIYTSCFPSRFVLSSIESKKLKDVLLIVKHPFDWDGSTGFIPYSAEDLEIIKRYRIAVYSLHTPLDKNRNEAGLFSTAHAFCKVIGLKPEGEFGKESDNNPYMKIGVLGSVIGQNLSMLSRSISSRLKQNVKSWEFNPGLVKKIGIITGGGSEKRLLIEAKAHGLDTYITGVTKPNAWPPSNQLIEDFFATAKKFNINIIGASHYLTEKWALELSMPYFSRLGVPAEFIEDIEALNKLD